MPPISSARQLHAPAYHCRPLWPLNVPAYIHKDISICSICQKGVNPDPIINQTPDLTHSRVLLTLHFWVPQALNVGAMLTRSLLWRKEQAPLHGPFPFPKVVKAGALLIHFK